MKFSTAFEAYMKNLKLLDRSSETIKGYQKELKYLNSWLVKRNNCQVFVEDISQADLEDYYYYLKEKGLEPASRSRAQYIHRSFFKYIHVSGAINKNPAALIGNIKVPKKERTFLENEEAMSLIGAIEQEIVRFAVHLLYMTGLRVSEAVSLKLEDVDIVEKTVKVRHGKGDKARIVPINDKMARKAMEYVNNTRPKVDSEYFLATKKTGRLSPQYINREIKKAAKAIELKKEVSAHILRHSYATQLIKKDVNIVNVSKLLGHSSVKVTSIYTHSSLQDLRESVSVL